MEELYPFMKCEEKNPHKFTIEIGQPCFIRTSKSHYEIGKNNNSIEEEKPSNDLNINKPEMNTANLFLISNLKENNPNEKKSATESLNHLEKCSSQNSLKTYIIKENEDSDSNLNNEYHSGRWSNEEHQKFIEGIINYGNEWKRVQSIIKTRSSTQARSHAQKFFLRMKKEINQNVLSDQNQLVNYIINSSNIPNNNTNLSQEQKDRLFSVIRSNLKPDESQKIIAQNINNYKDGGKKIDNMIEEDDNLAYDKEKIIEKNINRGEIGEKRKITFCSRKRKNSSDDILNVNEYKIFNIHKDKNHKKSLDVIKGSEKLINKFCEQNKLEKRKKKSDLNNFNQNMKNINNNINMSNNFNKNININNDIIINKTGNQNNYLNLNNNTNLIIQNNFYNIINNYNGNINNNIINYNLPINQNFPNNDSINSDASNHNNKIFVNNDNSKIKEKNNNKQNNGNEQKIYENVYLNNNFFDVFKNENFFPNTIKNNHNDKNNDNTENDPFNLNFENEVAHNDKILINENNIFINNNIENEQKSDYYELEKMDFGDYNDN